MCAPVSQTRPDSSEGEFLMIQTYLPGNTRSPSFLRDSSFHRSLICVPLSRRQDLMHQRVNSDDSNLPSRKHHRCRSPQGEADSHQQELHPSYVEMLNAIRELLYLEVPQVECCVAPSFPKEPSKQVVR